MSKKNKIIEFLKKNGFYLCLALCVAAAGVAVALSAGAKPEEETPAEQVQAIQSPIVKSEEKAQVTVPAPDKTPAPTVEPAPPAAEEKKEESSSKKNTKTVLLMPLDGQITAAYSGDTLVYNATLNMWMTHNGVDITSSSSKDVICALAGEVKRVYNDDTRGTVIEIEHANGAKTVYSGLSEAAVSEGALVNAGAKIGKTGTPAFEATLGEHLHFEYMVNGEYKDPTEYFKK